MYCSKILVKKVGSWWCSDKKSIISVNLKPKVSFRFVFTFLLNTISRVIFVLYTSYDFSILQSKYLNCPQFWNEQRKCFPVIPHLQKLQGVPPTRSARQPLSNLACGLPPPHHRRRTYNIVLKRVP